MEFFFSLLISILFFVILFLLLIWIVFSLTTRFLYYLKNRVYLFRFCYIKYNKNGLYQLIYRKEIIEDDILDYRVVDKKIIFISKNRIALIEKHPISLKQFRDFSETEQHIARNWIQETLININEQLMFLETVQKNIQTSLSSI